MLKLGAGVAQVQRVLFGLPGCKSVAGRHSSDATGSSTPCCWPECRSCAVIRGGTIRRGHHRRHPSAGRADLASALAGYRLYCFEIFVVGLNARVRKDALTPPLLVPSKPH
jgi:hypothetical protein